MKSFSLLVLTLILLVGCNLYSKIKGQNISTVSDLSHNKVDVDQLDKYLSYRLEDTSKKYGFINIDEEIIIEPIFSNCTHFFGEYANVIKDSTYGYINLKGEIKLFPEFDEVYWYYSNIGYGKKKDKYCLINRTGEKITELIYDNITLSNCNYFKVKTNGQWEIIDQNGEFLFKDRFRLDRTMVFDGYTTYQNKNKEGLINIAGNIVIEAKYDKVEGYFSSGLIRVKNNDKIGYLNKKAEAVIPVEYDDLGYYFYEGLVSAQSTGKWGFLDSQGKVVIDFLYDAVRPFSEGLAQVTLDNKVGYIDKNNDVVIPIELDCTWRGDFEEGLAVFKTKECKYGYINKKGEVVIDPIYDSALGFKNEIAFVKIAEKSGFISKTGEPLIKIGYSKLWSQRSGMFKFSN